jgi:predicted nuclease of predicted toxin-antitoxin system
VKVLLDECVDPRLAAYFKIHEVKTVKEMGWLGITNGELLKIANPHFDAFVTVDQNIPYQQNLEQFKIIVVIVRGQNLRARRLAALIPDLEAAIDNAKPGQVVSVP